MTFYNTQLQDITLKIINLCGYQCKHFSQLHNIIIKRESLISHGNYKIINPFIHNIKKIISSSNFNSLHFNAQKKQKWPLLNLLLSLY